MDILTRSAKPRVELDAVLSPGGTEGTVELSLDLSFPEDDVPEEIRFAWSGPVEVAEDGPHKPDGAGWSHTLNLRPNPDTLEFELDISVRHGLYYTTVVPSVSRKCSLSFPGVTLIEAIARKDTIVPGEEARFRLMLEGPKKGADVEIWGELLDPAGRGIGRFGKIADSVAGKRKIDVSADISEVGYRGKLDVRVTLRNRGVKEIRTFENAVTIAPDRDIRLTFVTVEPGLVLSGDNFTISGELENRGFRPAGIIVSAGIMKDDELIMVREMDRFDLEGQTDDDPMGLFLSYDLKVDEGMPEGKFEAFIHIGGDADIRTPVPLVIGTGRITVVGVVPDEQGYFAGETIRIRGLFRRDEGAGAESHRAVAALIGPGGAEIARCEKALSWGKPADGGAKDAVVWTFDCPDSVGPGPLELEVTLFEREGDGMIAAIRIPYTVYIRERLDLQLVAETERRMQGKKNREFLFVGEKVLSQHEHGRLTVMSIESGIDVLLLDGRLPGTGPKDLGALERELFPFIGERMGLGREYLRELRENIDGLLDHLETIACKGSMKRKMFRGGTGDREVSTAPGQYVTAIMGSHRKRMEKQIDRMPGGTKKKMMSERVSVDEYLCQNLLASAFKRAGANGGPPPVLFEHLAFAGTVMKKTGKLSKNTNLAFERAARYDPDFIKELTEHTGLLYELLEEGNYPNRVRKALKAMVRETCRGHGGGSVKNESQEPQDLRARGTDDPVTDGGGKAVVEEVFAIAVCFLSCMAFARVSKRSNIYESKKSIRNSISLIHDLHVAALYLHLFLDVSEVTGSSPSRRIGKARRWLMDFIGRFTADMGKVMSEVMRALADHASNSLARKNAIEFRRSVDVEPRRQMVDCIPGSVAELSLKLLNRGDDPISVDIRLQLPRGDFAFHGAGSKRQGAVYLMEGRELSAGSNDIDLSIEIPTASVDKNSRAYLLAYACRGNLSGRKDSPLRLARDDRIKNNRGGRRGTAREKDSPSFPEEQLELIISRVLGKGTPGDDPEGAPLAEDMTKEMGIPKRKFMNMLRDCSPFRLEEVPMKGGFLGLKTVVGHRIRFMDTDELIAAMDEGRIGNAGFATDPDSALRLINAYLKRMNSLPNVKGGSGSRFIRSPPSPAVGAPVPDIEGGPDEPGSASRNRLNSLDGGFAREMQIGGRKVDSIEGLLRVFLETDPRNVITSMSEQGVEGIFDSSGEGRIMAGIWRAVQIKMLLDEIDPVEARTALFSRLQDTPLGESFFYRVVLPKINNLEGASRGNATRTLGEIKLTGSRYISPALSDMFFQLDPEVRPLVMELLGELGDERAIPTLGKILRTSADTEERIGALAALLGMELPRSGKLAEEVCTEDGKLCDAARKAGLELPEWDRSREKAARSVILD